MATKSPWYWHFHHGKLAERVLGGVYGAADRRREIPYKPHTQVRLRLRLLRRASPRSARLLSRLERQRLHPEFNEGCIGGISSILNAKDREAFAAAHRRDCPGCPWNDTRRTIFTRRKKNGEWY